MTEDLRRQRSLHCKPDEQATIRARGGGALRTARGGSGSLHLSSRRTFTGYPRQS